MATIERVVTFSAPGQVGSPVELKSRYENLIGRAETVHAIAHSVARIIANDHLQMVEQLQRAGVHLDSGD